MVVCVCNLRYKGGIGRPCKCQALGSVSSNEREREREKEEEERRLLSVRGRLALSDPE
jgi:hypothetical protein